MTFDALPAGAMVFLDANCLVYAATADPAYGAACQRLLDEIENKARITRSSVSRGMNRTAQSP
jgi:predicted nucleic acid-binding protein